MSKNYVIIVAGGTGSRMNSQLPKQYLLLGERPVLMHTIEQFSIAGSAPEIIVVIHPTMHDTWNVLCAEHGFKVPHTVIYGGQTRFQSVKRGLEKIVEFEKEHLEKIVIAVHDAARPVMTFGLLMKVLNRLVVWELLYLLLTVLIQSALVRLIEMKP